MKTSLYNWQVRRHGTSIIYNCFTGAMYQLDEEHAHFGNILEQPGINPSTDLFDEGSLKALESAGFLIADDFDEKTHLEGLMESARAFGFMKLTVVITRKCNFRCSYCIQGSGVQDDAVIGESQLRSMRNMLFDLAPASIHTTLYGGEPLLYPEACFKTLETVKTVDPNAMAMLVTNGYLLDKDMVRRLCDYGAVAAQITIDGPEEVHDRRRTTKDGKGTYKKVLENTLQAAEHMHVLIRVNVESDMEFDYTAFRKQFEGNERIFVYRAPTMYNHQGNAEKGSENFHSIETKVCGEEMFSKKLNARFPGCAITTQMCAVILPEGKLVRCWNQVQDPSDCYSISKNGLFASHETWRSWNPFIIPECSECRMLPICGGGCPDRYLKTGVPSCRYTKEGFENFIFENFKARTR